MRHIRFALTTLCFAAGVAAQQPPPSLVVEGVPAVPRELVRKLVPYQNIRGAAFQSWHPTRRELLIATRFGETVQVHHLRTPGGARRQLTFFREPATTARYSPLGKPWFVFSMDEGGAEFDQIYRYDLSTGEHHLLTDGKSRNTMGPFSTRGDRVAFTSTKRNGRDFDIYAVDPENPASVKMIYQAEGDWFPLDWSHDDSRLLLGRYVSINRSEIFVLDPATGKTEPLFPAEKEDVAWTSARFSKNGKGVYVVSDRGSEFRRLFYCDLATKKLTPLTDHIPWDVMGLELSVDGGMLAFTSNEDGIGRLRLLSTATHKEVPLPKLPAGQLTGGRFHPKLPEVAFGIISAKSPGDVYSFNWKTGELSRWTESEAGGLNTASFPETELIRYPTFDKVDGKPRMIPAFITRPPARFRTPYPVLIDIHGGPESQARPGLNASYLINELGIARIQPNVRGSAGYGKSYLKLDNATLREDSVKDIGALLDWISRQPDLDARRVAVTGGSYGGYMVLASAVHFSDRLRCGIDVVGVSNWVTFLQNTQSYRQDLRRAEYGDERDPKMRDFFESISPLNHVQKIKMPLLIVQGRNDPRVPASESLQMVQKLRTQGNTVWYIEGKDEGHGFSKKTNRDYQTWAEILFLREFLLK